MMKKCMLGITVGLAAGLGLGLSTANAELIAYEGFATPGDYTAGTSLEGQQGGIGFTGNWVNTLAGDGVADALVTSSDSLSHGALTTTDGSLSKDSGKRANVYARAITLPDGVLDDGNELWMSMLFQRVSGTSNWYVTLSAPNNSQGGVGFGGQNGELHVRAYLQETGLATTSDGSGYEAGEVLFLVARISNVLNVGDHTVDVWVNPDPGVDLAAVALGGGDSTITRSYDGLPNVDELRIYSHQNNALIFDEIRVSTTFGALVPEPASLALLAVGVGMMVGRRRV